MKVKLKYKREITGEGLGRKKSLESSGDQG